MRLLERDEALATLHRMRSESSTDGGRLLFVEGEAGVGKTSLLRAFRDAVADLAPTVFGSCDPLSTPRPLGPLVDIAPDLDPQFARVLESAAPRPEILPAFLAALRRHPGVTVFLDDLHWADEATLDLLRYARVSIARWANALT